MFALGIDAGRIAGNRKQSEHAWFFGQQEKFSASTSLYR